MSDAEKELLLFGKCFKPCYKWITFNTKKWTETENGCVEFISFKPCYKWITFNTTILKYKDRANLSAVLNLVINGLPSIHKIWIHRCFK